MKSEQARAAKRLKDELKSEFPDVDFSVTSDSFAGGTSVDVRWTDGVTTQQVKAIADKYQKGAFDGMRDLYEYDRVNDDLPQAKYVQVQRSWSDQAKADIKADICDAFGIDPDTEIWKRPEQLGGMELRTKMHRQFSDTDFTE